MKRSKIFLLICVLLVMLFPTQQPVQADMAPLPAPSLGGLRPVQYQATEVQMVFERVELTIQPKPETDDTQNNEQVDVTAWFVLHNTGAKAEDMKAAFPLDNLTPPCSNHERGTFGLQTFTINDSSFKITRDGLPLDVEIKEIDGIECVRWAVFDIRFPVNQDVVVRVDYSGETWGYGYDMLLQYILETGAGWKGPIKQAYIVARFPYITTDENINTALTTPDFQYLYNEIFWSYRDLEPTPDDNISIRFFEPLKWEKILALRDVVNQSPTDQNAWVTLLNHYSQSANMDKIHNAFEKALLVNPNSAELYALYAQQLMNECCAEEKGKWELSSTEKENFVRHVLPLINKALALDSTNKTALDLISLYQFYTQETTFTPPPTIPPTVTPLVSATASGTPSQTRTPLPTIAAGKVEVHFFKETVIVVQTRIVTAEPASTSTLQPTSTSSPFSQPTVTATPTQSSGELPDGLVWPFLLVAGFAGGVWFGRRKAKG